MSKTKEEIIKKHIGVYKGYIYTDLEILAMTAAMEEYASSKDLRIAELEKDFVYWKLEATAKGKRIAELELWLKELLSWAAHLPPAANNDIQKAKYALKPSPNE